MMENILRKQANAIVLVQARKHCIPQSTHIYKKKKISCDTCNEIETNKKNW